MKTLSTFPFGQTIARYVTDEASGRVGLELYPAALESKRVTPREDLSLEPEIAALPGNGAPRARNVDPLVHVKIVGDPYPGAFAQGRTMREASSVRGFRFEDQTVTAENDETTVLTTLVSEAGCRIEHRLSWHGGDGAAKVVSRFVNGSQRPVTLEMLTSFSLGGITPFHAADAPNRLRVHRFRSVWSAEGRLDSRSIEELHLERSWSGSGLFSERFGQVGSMPVRGWFPFAAVEDTGAGVVWGAQVAWAGSWQMEIARRGDDVCLSGGLADREFGHWMRTLAPGEALETPPAVIACVHGDLDDLCDRLTALQARAADAHPAVEHDLPIVFNEWCTTWGDPTHESVVALADRLKGSEVRYLVIDAGWYKGNDGFWGNAHGDWNPSAKLFPQGLEATAAAVRERGLIPGLWFEMETCGPNSIALSTLVDHMLRRDGVPIVSGERRFWDMNDAVAVDYLTEKVIGLLERCGFGYLKVDYNETIGIGTDGAESQGEGLRRQIEGVYRFFDRIRARMPDLVIENCSSGGHRLEPSMIGRTAMSSFSDAHELREIPIVAANLHRLMLPRQSQIWAVLHETDSDRRLAYSLAATFLGRMCLSGTITKLSEAQWTLVEQAMGLYREAAPVIKNGVSRRFGDTGPSWRHPQGWQAMVRYSDDTALVVLHAYAGAPESVEIPLPPGPWKVAGAFPGASSSELRDGAMNVAVEGEFSARVLLLSR